MAGQAKCPVCYPPRWNDAPPEVSLRPNACPARDNHERITRMFELLGRIETHHPLDSYALQQLQSRIDGIRQPAQEAIKA